MPEIGAEAAARNRASLRVLAKLGFRHVKSCVDDADGELCERFVLAAPGR
jgi:ribosomal-protein-alanine N-acetyltransferase